MTSGTNRPPTPGRVPTMTSNGSAADVLGFTPERVSGEGVLLPTLARMLNITVLDVRNRIVDGDLWAPRVNGVRRVPWWQFVRCPAGVPGARYWSLPWLDRVIPALPRRAPVAVVGAFMTSPHGLLRVGCQGMTPSRWLACGGAPDPVITAVQDLDRQ